VKKLGSSWRDSTSALETFDKNALHKLTTRITKSFDAIAIEDLNVKGMVRNRRLARAILDMGFYEFRRQIVYKSRLRRCHVFDVDRWFPSTKMCSRCHVVKDSMPLGERMFRCDACGFVIDRDVNAARNNAWVSFDPLSTVSSTGLEAWGEESAGSCISMSETDLYEAGIE
jgi:putative transposase